MLKNAAKEDAGATSGSCNGGDMAYFDRLQARIEALAAENALLRAELRRHTQDTPAQPQAATA